MNPYNTPETDQSSDTKPHNNELREIVIGWERMRVLYNIIMFLVGVVAIFISTRAPYFSLEEALFPAIIFGIFSNICFCSGPTIEIYYRVIFNPQDKRSLRLILFVLGTLLSLMPAFMVIAGYFNDAGWMFF